MTQIPASILIIKTSSIGDVVLTTPVAEAIRSAYPDVHLTWLVEEKVADVILGNPFIDQVIIWKRPLMRQLRKSHQWGAFADAIRELRGVVRERCYDYCFDLQGFDRTLLVHTMVRARRRFTLPIPDCWQGYTKAVWRRHPLEHASALHLNVLRRAGIALPAGVPPLRITFSPTDIHSVAQLLSPISSAQPIVAINPATTWPAKKWPVDRFARIAGRLKRELGCSIVLIGGRRESDVCQEVASQAGVDVLDVSGRTTLKELAALLTRCSCLVTSDSGPMHIAAAAGTSVVALFGPTSPANYGPLGPQHTILYRDLPCSPCRNTRLVNPPCMDELSVDMVFEAVRDRVHAGRLISLG